MKKNVLSIILTLVFFAGATSLQAQWMEYHADVLPQDDVSGDFGGQFSEKGTVTTGTSEIISDPDNAENNLWYIDVDSEGADEIKTTWQPSYYDQVNDTPEKTSEPSTFAVKYRWIAVEGYDAGFDMEIREVHKVRINLVKKGDDIRLKVKDKNLDSLYFMPEDFDVTEWHLIRFTMDNGAWNVYIDEGETPFASGTANKQIDKHVVNFGTFGEDGKTGVEVDWMGYIDSEAGSPSDAPLPAGIFDETKQWEPYDPNSATMVENYRTQSLTVYPNPVNEIMTISVDEKFVNSDYTIIESSGRTIQSGVISSTNHTINMASAPSGVYYVRIVTNNSVLGGSLIKK